MTNEAIVCLIDHLSNEARNAIYAASAMLEPQQGIEIDPTWHSCLRASRTSTDRFLRTLDDVREVLSGPAPVAEPVEEVDLSLCVGEIVMVLNLSAGRGDPPRLTFGGGREPVAIRQNRRALDDALVRIVKLGLKLYPGDVYLTVSADRADTACLRITLSEDAAGKLLEWMQADLSQLDWAAPDISLKLSALVAGIRLRGLGGAAAIDRPASRDDTCLEIRLTRDVAANAENATASAIAPLQILIVEDCDESFALTERMLRGESVERARTGLEALDRVRGRRYDVIFMDIHMPGINGYESIREIRAWETGSGHARTPIVVFSSDDVSTQMRQAARSGCSAFLRKPVSAYDLMSVLAPLRATREALV